MIEQLSQQFGDRLIESSEAFGETRVTVKPETLVALCQYLKDELGFDYPIDLTAAECPELRLVVRLGSVSKPDRIAISVPVAHGARVPTLTGVYKAMDWWEREVYDLFGLTFPGHPDLRRILLPDDWSGYPLLKGDPSGKA